MSKKEIPFDAVCKVGEKCGDVPSHMHLCPYCSIEGGSLILTPLTVCSPDELSHRVAVHSLCGQMIVLNFGH